MHLKTNLHLHTKDDPADGIPFSFEEYVDRAAALGFSALAVTCHGRFVDDPAYRAYASERKILFIPGIELEVEKAHVVVLGCDRSIEDVREFAALRAYKRSHPEVLVLAPHPYFPGSYVLGEKLEKNIDVFDAVECSWFYSKHIDFNRRAERTAEQHDLPYIATSDTHDPRFLDTSYAVIDAAAPTVRAVLAAVREKKFENRTGPRKLIREMAASAAAQTFRNLRARLSRRSGA